MSNKEVSAGIRIYDNGTTWSWNIMLMSSLSSRQDQRVCTNWVYGSPASAKAAARRWCKLLNLPIEYIEVEE